MKLWTVQARVILCLSLILDNCTYSKPQLPTLKMLVSCESITIVPVVVSAKRLKGTCNIFNLVGSSLECNGVPTDDQASKKGTSKNRHEIPHVHSHNS